MSWIQTFTGRRFFPLAPRPEDVCIEDIAHALSNQCRWTGHTRQFYSVAQHSCYVSEHCPPNDALWGLLHDATEAYLMDLARPVKQDPSMAVFRDAEEVLHKVIGEHFGLKLPIPESVLKADNRLLLTEQRDLMTFCQYADTGSEQQPYPERIIRGWPPPFAEVKFLQLYNRVVLLPR